MGTFDKSEIIKYHMNETDEKVCGKGFDIVNNDIIESVTCFHKSLPGYVPTPLVKLSVLAGYLGVDEICVKDESKRFDLNAFKVLGASYAMAKALMKELGLGSQKITFEDLVLNSDKIKHLTFVTATDGNHGRAVAWAAERFGCKAVVYMPKGSSKARVEAIHSYGAKASILDCNYDEAVIFSENKAKENNWVLLQDTSFSGYEEIPEYVMQGYFSLITEVMDQGNDIEFTHVFVQAGVGSLAAALLAYLCNLFGKLKPIFVVVEATGAPCFYESMSAGDGKPHTVHGDLETIMAGLACGKPSEKGWEILKAGADAFVACSDEIARKGMRVLGNPMGNDTRVVSGESGAVTLGLVFSLLNDGNNKDLRKKLKINYNSKILLFSTEGDTDPQHYREVVW
jgi:diaminopropionate ammonia-lyase